MTTVFSPMLQAVMIVRASIEANKATVIGFTTSAGQRFDIAVVPLPNPEATRYSLNGLTSPYWPHEAVLALPTAHLCFVLPTNTVINWGHFVTQIPQYKANSSIPVGDEDLKVLAEFWNRIVAALGGEDP